MFDLFDINDLFLLVALYSTLPWAWALVGTRIIYLFMCFLLFTRSMNCTLHEIDSLSAQLYDILNLIPACRSLYFISFTRVQIFIFHIQSLRPDLCASFDTWERPCVHRWASKHATAPYSFFMFFTFINLISYWNCLLRIYLISYFSQACNHFCYYFLNIFFAHYILRPFSLMQLILASYFLFPGISSKRIFWHQQACNRFARTPATVWKKWRK